MPVPRRLVVLVTASLGAAAVLVSTLSLLHGVTFRALAAVALAVVAARVLVGVHHPPRRRRLMSTADRRRVTGFLPLY